MSNKYKIFITLNTTTNNDEKSDNLLQYSFNLLINLISQNHKLLVELDSKEDIKQALSSLIKRDDHIGDGAIIGANCVVCSNVESQSLLEAQQ